MDFVVYCFSILTIFFDFHGKLIPWCLVIEIRKYDCQIYPIFKTGKTSSTFSANLRSKEFSSQRFLSVFDSWSESTVFRLIRASPRGRVRDVNSSSQWESQGSFVLMSRAERIMGMNCLLPTTRSKLYQLPFSTRITVGRWVCWRIMVVAIFFAILILALDFLDDERVCLIFVFTTLLPLWSKIIVHDSYRMVSCECFTISTST